MLYPGSVYLLQKALMPVLLQGPARLVEEVRPPYPSTTHPHSLSPPTHECGLLPFQLGQCILSAQCHGRRAKLLACDGNEIDTMFVDRRGTAEPQGQKLVSGHREPKGRVWGGQWKCWGLLQP